MAGQGTSWPGGCTTTPASKPGLMRVSSAGLQAEKIRGRYIMVGLVRNMHAQQPMILTFYVSIHSLFQFFSGEAGYFFAAQYIRLKLKFKLRPSLCNMYDCIVEKNFDSCQF